MVCDHQCAMYPIAGIIFHVAIGQGEASYQGLTQALGALLDWAEELLKRTQSLWWLAGFRQSTCRTRTGEHLSGNTMAIRSLTYITFHSVNKASWEELKSWVLTKDNFKTPK